MAGTRLRNKVKFVARNFDQMDKDCSEDQSLCDVQFVTIQLKLPTEQGSLEALNPMSVGELQTRPQPLEQHFWALGQSESLLQPFIQAPFPNGRGQVPGLLAKPNETDWKFPLDPEGFMHS